MSISLGINPLTWSNDDMPELGADITLETCLREAREVGFSGVELGRKFPRDAARLLPLLDKHGLKLISGWYGAHLLERDAQDEIQAMAGHVRLLRDTRCGVVVFAEVSGCIHTNMNLPLSKRPVMREPEWIRLCSRLNVVAEHLEESGMRLAYHHHMGTVIESEQDVCRLMEETRDSVGLLLDTGHMLYARGDPHRLARRYGPRIAHVHCKDVRAHALRRAGRLDSSFLAAVLEGVFTVPGDGCIDYPEILRQLKASGYGGWLVVEADQDPAKAHPKTYARLGIEGLRQAAQAAGLEIG